MPCHIRCEHDCDIWRPVNRSTRPRLPCQLVAALGAHLFAPLGFAARYRVFDGAGRCSIAGALRGRRRRLQRGGRGPAERDADLWSHRVLGAQSSRLSCVVAHFGGAQQPRRRLERGGCRCGWAGCRCAGLGRCGNGCGGKQQGCCDRQATSLHEMPLGQRERRTPTQLEPARGAAV
jgi:hypothetical protein